MKIAIAGDGAGEGLAQVLAGHLAQIPGYEVTEASRTEAGPDDFYANLADRVARDVLTGRFDKAILICGTGIGVCLSANKVPGIRAAQCHDTYSAGKAATSNNAQIITLGARVVGPELAKDIADAFLSAAFDPEGRSAGNVRAIDALDAKYHSDGASQPA